MVAAANAAPAADNVIKKEFGWLVICPVCKGEVMVYPKDWGAVTCASGHWINRKGEFVDCQV